MKTNTTGIAVNNAAQNTVAIGKMIGKDTIGTVVPVADTVLGGTTDIIVETAKGFGAGCLKAAARASINAGSIKETYAKNLKEFQTQREENKQVLAIARETVQQRKLEKELTEGQTEDAPINTGNLVTA